jgi:hypothetical protein
MGGSTNSSTAALTWEKTTHKVVPIDPLGGAEGHAKLSWAGTGLSASALVGRPASIL